MPMYNTAADYVKVEPLIQLRNFLISNSDIVQEHLDMSGFCSKGDTIDDTGLALEAIQSDTACGTTMCLAGWAATVPAIQKAYSETEVPEDRREDIVMFSYMAFFQESNHNNGIWDYLFSDLWYSDLEHGLQRIGTIIEAARLEDLDTLQYFKEYGYEIANAVSDEDIDPESPCVFELYLRSDLERAGVDV